MIVGKPVEVGTYVLRKGKEGGYLLWVSKSKVETLNGDYDYLFNRQWDFVFPLVSID